MKLLDPTYIRDICDYSFGDESGVQIGGYMKIANNTNIEFLNKYQSLIGNKEYMTLFIDNIRLYKRGGIKYTAMELANPHMRVIKDQRVQGLINEDLLALCSSLPDMNFVIFTGFEDTPIDEFIFDRIPNNVIAIYASNATTFGGKVRPIPYGIQRRLTAYDFRHELLLERMGTSVSPTKLVYVNHSVGTNPIRVEIDKYFSNMPWATVKHPINFTTKYYEDYLTDIQNHKFMICPSGNAIGCECHRDWETIYMRRVPIVQRSEYLEYIFKDIPVLFIDEFTDVTEDLLEKNDYLFEEMKVFDLSKLDIENVYKKSLEEIEKCI